MNIWKASPLQSGQDVIARFLFRLLWCSIGLVIGLVLWGDEFSSIWIFIPLTILVPCFGAGLDLYRLKNTKHSVGRVWFISFVFSLIMVVLFVIAGFVLKH